MLKELVKSWSLLTDHSKKPLGWWWHKFWAEWNYCRYEIERKKVPNVGSCDRYRIANKYNNKYLFHFYIMLLRYKFDLYGKRANDEFHYPQIEGKSNLQLLFSKGK